MTEAKPTHYTLSLTPCLQTATFTGTVAIKILILSTTIALKLNAHELAISNVTLLSSSSSDEFPIASTSTNTETQTFKILLKDHVTANTNLVLKLEFAGVLRRDGEGLGWFLPLAAQGGGGGFAVTQFEPILARTTFPCFDDPSFKAVFSVQMTIPRNLTALSNMPVRSTEDMDVDVAEAVVVKERKKVVLFEDTPVIPTYLLAFVVGDFEFLELENGNGNGNGKEDEDKDEVVLRAYVPKGAEYKVEQCRYGLQTAKRCINILSSLLEYPFPLPKLDLLLVPGMCGGMENWGLITLATKSFLVAADNSAADKVVVAQIIAHEIAHTWFGNLVTPTSWDDFWFKEGLSEWAELECRERMEGDLEPFKDWAADGLQVAIFASAWKQVHPLVAKVGDEVAKPMFDDTTYRKGCAVIIMLANYLRDEFFIQGLRLFVRLHAFGNATSEDLWSAMSQVSGADVGAFVRPWVKGLGIPLVEVGEIEKPFRVNVKQSTFRMARLEAVEEDDNLLPIPLEVVTAKGISGELLSERAKLIKMTPDFYSVNRGNAGFFIVGYSADRLRCICQDMHKGTLSVKERIGLISNAAALVWSCHPSMRTSDLLNLLQHFEDEENFFVWKVIISVLEGLKRYLMFENDKMIVAFERFWKRLVKRCLYRIGRCSVDDNINEQRFKAMLFGNSGGDDMVFKAAEVMFRCFVKKEGKSINPNLRAEVFKVVLRKKGKREVCYHSSP